MLVVQRRNSSNSKSIDVITSPFASTKIDEIEHFLAFQLALSSCLFVYIRVTTMKVISFVLSVVRKMRDEIFIAGLYER